MAPPPPPAVPSDSAAPCRSRSGSSSSTTTAFHRQAQQPGLGQPPPPLSPPPLSLALRIRPPPPQQRRAKGKPRPVALVAAAAPPAPSVTTLHLTRLLDEDKRQAPRCRTAKAAPLTRLNAGRAERNAAVSLPDPRHAAAVARVSSSSRSAAAALTDIFGTVRGGLRFAVAAPLAQTAAPSRRALRGGAAARPPKKRPAPPPGTPADLAPGRRRSGGEENAAVRDDTFSATRKRARNATATAIDDYDDGIVQESDLPPTGELSSGKSRGMMPSAAAAGVRIDVTPSPTIIPTTTTNQGSPPPSERPPRPINLPLLCIPSQQQQRRRYPMDDDAHRRRLPRIAQRHAAAPRASTPLTTTADDDTTATSAAGPVVLSDRADVAAPAPSLRRPALSAATAVSMNAPPACSSAAGNAAARAIPRPASATDAVANTNTNNRSSGGGHAMGNFVRLNLRNKAGSCRGARNTKTKSKARLQWEQRKQDREEHYQAMHGGQQRSSQEEWGVNQLFAKGGAMAVSTAGVDPVDDFVDGVFAPRPPGPNSDAGDGAARPKLQARRQSKPVVPPCTGHQQPCKLLTVKKAGPNRGRTFYACPCPRGEQCNQFAWADDTVQAAQEALLQNRSLSGFIARQVAAHAAQMKGLTVPELQALARRHGLDASGKKAPLLMRLSIWVRDEVARGTAEMGLPAGDDDDAPPTPSETGKADHALSGATGGEKNDEDDDECIASASAADDDDDDSSSSSDEELELTGAKSSSFGFPGSDSTDHNGESGNVTTTQILPRRGRGRCLTTTAGSANKSTTDAFSGDEDEGGDVADEGARDEPSHSKVPTMHSTLCKLFGYSKFRDGQEWAIRRCLNKQRSLLVAPTGFGKSLCFTLPAAMMPGVCIVVSPLLSLIQDQIRALPARLPAVTLSGPMSTASVAATLDDIVRGRIKLLFVSPERLTSASFRRLFRRRWNAETRRHERFFPEVSLFCVDEAHCLSQWAHNFRPSYLRLRSIIEMIEPLSVLAITATAGPRVVDDICRALKIEKCPPVSDQIGEHVEAPVTGGVRVSKTDRDNIDVRCLLLDTQEERLSKLMKILGKPKPQARDVDGCLSSGSVIVYVWRQRDAEVVAENIQAGGIDGGVVVYHGGMDSTSRTKAQGKFMRGKVRICVATIAFGLGINKADVAGVIHLYLSSSPETYIQEIGRAGRDGRPAKAIALVLKDEVVIRHSLAHSDLISKSQVWALLSLLHCQVVEALSSLPPDRSKVQPVSVSFSLAMSVLGCDCKTETVETILSLLEQRDDKVTLLFIEGTSYDFATIAPKRCLLEKLAEREPIAKAILHCSACVEPPSGHSVDSEYFVEPVEARRQKLVGHTFGTYSFSVAQCSNCLGEAAEPRHVFAALRRLMTIGEIAFALDTAPKDRVLSLRLTNEGMKYFNSDENCTLDELTDEIMERFVSTITACANKVIDINHIMRKVCETSRIEIGGDDDREKSASLALFQSLIGNYFEAEGKGEMLASGASDLPEFTTIFTTRELSIDAQAVLTQLQEIHEGMQGKRLLCLGEPTTNDYTALMITKFLHGLAPAGTPVNLIRQHHLFGKMQRVQFKGLHSAIYRLLEQNKK